jgi:hypothetical protein
VQVQLPNVDPAKQFAVDFRMQSTSYAAYMMVRDYQTVSLPAHVTGEAFPAAAVLCMQDRLVLTT